MSLKSLFLPLIFCLCLLGFADPGQAAKAPVVASGTTAAPVTWSDWTPMADGRGNAVDVAVLGPGTFDFGNGDRQYFYGFRNRYPLTVEIEVEFVTIEQGVSSTFTQKTTINPDGIDKDAEYWTLCSEFVSARVTSIAFSTPPADDPDDDDDTGDDDDDETTDPVALADLHLSGDASWEISKSKLSYTVGKITNESKKATSGNLRLEIWASSSPISNDKVSGKVLATTTLKPLKPGASYKKPKAKVSYSKLSSGFWYTTLVLLEKDKNKKFVVRDHLNFSGKTRF